MILLLSSNYREVEFAHNALVKKGDFIEAATFGGTLNGFCAFADVAANILGAYVVHADAVEATKDPGDNLAFAPGEKVYYNIAGAKVSKTTSDVLIGFAKRAALAADAVVVLNFDGKAQEDRPDIDSITLSQISDLANLTIEADQITDPESLSITMSQVSDLGDLALVDLGDVNAANPTNNDRLKWDTATSKWVLEAVAD